MIWKQCGPTISLNSFKASPKIAGFAKLLTLLMFEKAKQEFTDGGNNGKISLIEWTSFCLLLYHFSIATKRFEQKLRFAIVSMQYYVFLLFQLIGWGAAQFFHRAKKPSHGRLCVISTRLCEAFGQTRDQVYSPNLWSSY